MPYILRAEMGELLDVRMPDGEWYQAEVCERSLGSGGYMHLVKFTGPTPFGSEIWLNVEFSNSDHVRLSKGITKGTQQSTT